MDNILSTLSEPQIAVDLGCGGGSFRYASYKCRIVGLDVTLDSPALYREGSRIQYIRSNAAEVPLADSSVDAVFCNHTFEHFPEYRRVLSEIDRVLKPAGMLWISVPNGYSLDDALYRLIFAGGGHVNRFSFNQLVEAVHNQTNLRLVQSNSLFSGFVYLKRPSREQLQYFPARARRLYYIPERLNHAGILLINTVTRLADKIFGSHTSQYGWGFVFGRPLSSPLEPLPSYFNVCWKCGCGNDATYLKSRGEVVRKWGLRLFDCANCHATNVFFDPPAGLS